MTHREAITYVTEYTGENVLESLEIIQEEIRDGRRLPTPVRTAYYTLMAGFTELLG